MVLPNFGISEEIVHCEDVAYDHSCGNVQPGDSFTSDFFKVTCTSCVGKFAKKYTSAYIVELETELHFFRSSFPRAAENYKRMSAQQMRAPDASLGVWLHCMTCGQWHREKESCIPANRERR